MRIWISSVFITYADILSVKCCYKQQPICMQSNALLNRKINEDLVLMWEMFQTISLHSKFSSLGMIADFQIFKEIIMR